MQWLTRLHVLLVGALRGQACGHNSHKPMEHLLQLLQGALYLQTLEHIRLQLQVIIYFNLLLLALAIQ
jgi:hypothetical protein